MGLDRIAPCGDRQDSWALVVGYSDVIGCYDIKQGNLTWSEVTQKRTLVMQAGVGGRRTTPPTYEEPGTEIVNLRILNLLGAEM